MMRNIRILLVALAATACADEPTIGSGTAKPVIEAFLYAGEPVTHVRIASTLSLGSEDTTGIPINDAQVALIRSGVRFTLTRAAGDSGYYGYPGTDLVVREGDVFDLEVIVDGATATGRTTVPTQPGDVTLSADSIIIPSGGGRGGRGGGPGQIGTPLIVQWPNATRELYYVTVENEDTTAVQVAGGRGGFRRFIFPPIDADSFAIAPLSLAYYGMHQVRVYHVNTEYAALYESRQQDTRDLNEPATNIQNGLGVFSAFSSRTVRFRAVAGQ